MEILKKRLSIVISVICIAVLTTTFLSSYAFANDTSIPAPDKNAVLETRFLNMLNHNYVYDEDISDANLIVNNSVFALLGSREGDYIPETVLKDFVSDMYGVDIISIDGISDGMVEIPICGYTSYKHKICSVVKNEDGSYLVTSKVKVTPHDADEYTAKVATLFVKNGNSAFGYNIIFSNFLNNASDI